MKNKEKPFVSLIVYAFNERRNIKRFLVRCDRVLSEQFENYELIVVNDASTDGTEAMINALKGKLRGNLIIVNMGWRHGLEHAMMAGIDFAIGDFVFEFDNAGDDFRDELIFDVYKKSLEGYDVVTVSPLQKSSSLSSKIFYKILKKISHLKISLETERMRLISRKGINSSLRFKDKLRYRKILYQYLGLPTAKIYYRPSGKIKSAISFGEKVRLGMDVVTYFSNIGLHLSFVASFVFLIISITVGIYALYLYLVRNTVIEGWTSLVLFMCFGFSGVFLVLGIQGRYQSVILNEVRQRPLYMIKSIDRLNK